LSDAADTNLYIASKSHCQTRHAIFANHPAGIKICPHAYILNIIITNPGEQQLCFYFLLPLISLTLLGRTALPHPHQNLKAASLILLGVIKFYPARPHLSTGALILNGKFKTKITTEGLVI